MTTQPITLDIDVEERSLGQRAGYILRLIRRDRSAMIGLTLFILITLAAVFAPVVSPHDPQQQNLRVARQGPAWTEGGSWEYPLGTDTLGRDMLSRIIYGTRVSLMVGFFGVLIAATLGMMAGLVAGYMGGKIDSMIMGGVNLFLAIPYLVFVVFIAAVLGRSLLNVILIFGISDSPIFARVTRGEVLRLRKSGYVESAVSVGASTPRILFDHILPNLVGPLITLATFEMSAMIFYEAGLSFLGLSVPPSVPSWGNMLATGRQYLTTYPWIATYPGIAIAVTALAMNLLGDWLRDVLDPRLRRSR
ncbi:MAG: ABC transporter permease [Chloroflexota bacterium]|jgi:ABC-type dipeptide/oligopeptide/nickel transport system permease subunit